MPPKLDKHLASTLLFLALAGPGLISTAQADPPHGSRANAHERNDRKNMHQHDKHAGNRHTAYNNKSGNCPPGLARKHNGCLPPGKATWRLGHPLPRDARYYDLPAGVLARLGPAPHGYRYVRVADDILLLGLGTNLVVEALTNLSR